MNSASESNVNPTPAEKSKASAREDHLAFLNSLPEVKKPEPKRSVLDEHLAFLDSLPKIQSQSIEAEPAIPAEESLQEAPKVSRKVKKKTQTQAMREERNRIEREKAEAKKLEMQKKQQEAEERERQTALEQEQALEAELANSKPLKKAFSKLVSA